LRNSGRGIRFKSITPRVPAWREADIVLMEAKGQGAQNRKPIFEKSRRQDLLLKRDQGW